MKGGAARMKAMVYFTLLLATTSSVTAAAPGGATSSEVIYGKPPAWILPPPNGTSAAAPEGAPVRIEYSDTQVRVIGDGSETYSAYRLKLLKPDALNLGNIVATW